MYPLLYKDGVAIPYFVAMLMLTLSAVTAARAAHHAANIKTAALTVSLSLSLMYIILKYNLIVQIDVSAWHLHNSHSTLRFVAAK